MSKRQRGEKGKNVFPKMEKAKYLRSYCNTKGAAPARAKTNGPEKTAGGKEKLSKIPKGEKERKKSLTREEKGGNISKSPQAAPREPQRAAQKNIKKVLDKHSTG